MTTIFSLPRELRELIYSNLQLPYQVLCQINGQAGSSQRPSPYRSMTFEWNCRNVADNEGHDLPLSIEWVAVRTLYALMRASKQVEMDLRLFIARTRKHIVQLHNLSNVSPEIWNILSYIGNCEIMFTSGKRERDPLELMTWVLSALHFIPRVRKVKISVRHGSDRYHWSEVQPKILPLALEAVDYYCTGVEEFEIFFGGVWDYKGPLGMGKGEPSGDFMNRQFLDAHLVKRRDGGVIGWRRSS